MSLIKPDDIFAMSAILVLGAAFAFWAESKKWGQQISGPVWAIFFGIILSNTNIIANNSSVFNVASDLLVPAAIPLLLFKANIKHIIAKSGAMFGAFLIGVIGTLIGVACAFYLVPLGKELSAEADKLAGVFTATYIGGSMNFVAVAKAVSFDDSSNYAAALTTDNILSVIYLLILVALPSISLIRKFFFSDIIKAAGSDSNEQPGQILNSGRLDLLHLSVALALSLFLCFLSQVVAVMLGIEQYMILFVTLFAVIIANIIPEKMAAIEGDFALGTFFMYLFFVTIGAAADISALAVSAVHLVPFVMVIIAVHMLILLVSAKIFKIDLAYILIASNACIMGPAPAAAVAAGKGWHSLITPAILCGILGYVIANFFGFAIFKIL